MLRKLTVALLALTMLVTLCGAAFAQSAVVEQNGFRVELRTDKDSYTSQEAISVTLSVENMNDAAVTSVALENFVPAGYNGANTYVDVDSLAAGATSKLTSKYTPFNIPNTGDSTPMLLLVALLLGSGAGLALLASQKRNAARRIFALLLCVGMMGSCFAGWPAYAAEEDSGATSRTITVTCTVDVDGVPLELQSAVRFTSGGVTREGWIVALVDVMGYELVTDGMYNFDDFDEADDPAAIETAIRNGLLNLAPDEDNIVRFYPHATATRDLLAMTAQRALMLTTLSKETPTWTDYASLPHQEAARMAVELGLLELENNVFGAAEPVSNDEMDQAIRAIRELRAEPEIPETPVAEMKLAETAEETTLRFSVDEEACIVTVYEPQKVRGWRVGEVHVLRSSDPAEADIAIKLAQIRNSGSTVLLYYEAPEFHEVFESVEYAGRYDGTIYFTPAEGVIIEPSTVARLSTQSRATVSDTFDINKTLSFSVPLGEGAEIGGSLSLDNIEYRLSASSHWRFPFVSLDEVYIAVNNTLELNADITLLDAPSFDDDDDDMIEIPLGTIEVPVGGGFNLEGSVEFVVTSDGVQLEISWDCHVKTGIQYTASNWIRPIFQVNPDPITPKISGEIRPQIEIELEGEFLRTIRIVEAGVDVGLCFAGELTGYDTPNIFCVDAKMYYFMTIFAEFGPEILNLRIDNEFINENNSPFKLEGHWEDWVKVNECTRGSGRYEGVVKDVGTGQPIYRAKVELYKNGNMRNVTYTDSNGVFKSVEEPRGNYTLRVSAAGYIPYETEISVIGGQTAQVPVQLMLGREDDAESGSQTYTITGRVTDATTGYGVSGARVTFHDASLFGTGEAAATVSTDSSGYYSASVPAGVYEISATKTNYVPNGRTLTILSAQSNINFALNPENQSAEGNTLRAVLEWGEYPMDLDSHLVGPTGHVYFSNMSIGNADLDVDDVTSYGPEEVHLYDADTGVYHYFVHDYSNCDSGYSTALSSSGAKITLYNGSIYLYTIYVPEGKPGTLWHVFDYDAATMEITLVNSFGYEEDAGNVGSAFYRTLRTETRSNDGPVVKTYTVDKHR